MFKILFLLFILIILKDIDFIKYRQVSISPLPSNHMLLFFVRLLDFYCIYVMVKDVNIDVQYFQCG